MNDAQYATQGLSSARDRVVAYYDQTWLDFRVLWSDSNSLALHYGYHDHIARGHAAALSRMNEVLADRAAIQPGKRVLDAGCGIGGSSLWLARQRAARVVGISLSKRQVAQARRAAQARGFGGQAAFAQADYTAAPFPDQSFDLIWALESICYAPEKAAFYREAARLLRPGGRLIAAEFLRSARPSYGGERLLRAWLDGWAMPDLNTRSEHLEAIARAGLANAQIENITISIQPSAYRLYSMARWALPIGAALQRVGLRTAVQHGNVVAALQQYRSLIKGDWWYAIISAAKPG